MPVPFEALIPYGVMLGVRTNWTPNTNTTPCILTTVQMFGFSGAALSKIRHMQNGGKRARHSVDQWDKQMMDRDRRLTGFLRGQTDNVHAPPGFELSNPWRMERGMN